MVSPHGAASIAELIVAAHGGAVTATTTMAMAARGAGAPARSTDAGVARLRGIMEVEAPTAPGEVLLPGAAALAAPQDSEAAPRRGAAAPVPITALTGVRDPGVVDNTETVA